MLLALIRKELLDHFLSLRFALSFALCFLILSAGILALTRQQVQEARAVSPFLESGQYRQILDGGSSVDLLNGGVSLVRGMPPLRTVCSGLQDLSLIATLKGSEEPAFRRKAFVSNPVPGLFLRFDLVSIVGAIVSLVAINLTYDAVCGEKQNGTLRLGLACGLPRNRFLAGKLVGSFLAFLAGYLPCVATVCLIVSVTPEVRMTAGDWGALTTILAASVLYASVFFSLGLLVSCRTYSPPASLIALLTLWAAAVFVVPGLSPFLAARLSPSRSPVEVEAGINALRSGAAQQGWGEVAAYLSTNRMPHRFRIRGRDYDDWDLALGSWVDAIPRVMRQVSDSSAASRLLRFSTGVLARRFVRVEQDVLQVRQAHIRTLERQMRLGVALSSLSPYATFTYLATDLSQTGLRSEWRFRQSVDRFKGEIVAYVGAQLASRTFFDRLDAARFPDFRYQPQESFLEPGDLAKVLLLVVLNAVLLFASHLSFLRYDVR